MGSGYHRIQQPYSAFYWSKTRKSLRYGKPEESITREKMNHLKKVAEEYQYLHPEWKYIQFDVLAITLIHDGVKEIFMIEDVYF